MSKVKNIVGQKFVRLLVIRFLYVNNLRCAIWECQCDCGAIVRVTGRSLRSGNTKSCGCLQKDTVNRHGHSGCGGVARTGEYRAWLGIIQRCCNHNNPDWSNYGGRGIKVCKRWASSFKNFLDDMGRKPTSKHSIDRIDNNDDYRPGNCRWATKREQDQNKRTNCLLTYNGETLCIAEWARRFNLHPVTLHSRIKKGWPTWAALTVKPIKGGNHERERMYQSYGSSRANPSR